MANSINVLAIPLESGREILLQFPQELKMEDLPYINLVESYIETLKLQCRVVSIPISNNYTSAISQQQPESTEGLAA